MGAGRDERVAVASQHQLLLVVAEPGLRHRARRVLLKALAEGGIGLEREEAAVQTVRGRRRKAIVRVLTHTAHTRHSTTAFPWCQEGS